jgi:hypothetical protein
VQHGKVIVAIRNSFLCDVLARVLEKYVPVPTEFISKCTPQQVLETLREAENARVVITDTAEDVLPGPCTHMLAQNPDLLVIVVSWQSDRVFAYQQITSVEELKGSAEEVISAVSRRLG